MTMDWTPMAVSPPAPLPPRPPPSPPPSRGLVQFWHSAIAASSGGWVASEGALMVSQHQHEQQLRHLDLVYLSLRWRPRPPTGHARSMSRSHAACMLACLVLPDAAVYRCRGVYPQSPRAVWPVAHRVERPSLLLGAHFQGRQEDGAKP